ncbi:outer membrane protein assembly factor BamB family protein [Longirhabdus pacifica]|uniref:outer membrane protein assembly factor BamB family protein n=1 Tax=Longirhabdus pacifica TaxID=2305227 RepID=UPI00100925DA|nr:PQQ-binding-like beta-propeller repeat protein [Longirhabdus pacifica]
MSQKTLLLFPVFLCLLLLTACTEDTEETNKQKQNPVHTDTDALTLNIEEDPLLLSHVSMESLLQWFDQYDALTPSDIRTALGPPHDQYNLDYFYLFQYDFAKLDYEHQSHWISDVLDMEGLKSGDMKYQLLLYWDKEDNLHSYRVYFSDERGDIQTTIHFQDDLALTSSYSPDNKIGYTLRDEEHYFSFEVPTFSHPFQPKETSVPTKSTDLSTSDLITASNDQYIEINFTDWIPKWFVHRNIATTTSLPLTDSVVQSSSDEAVSVHLYPDGPAYRSIQTGEHVIAYAQYEDWIAILDDTMPLIPHVQWISANELQRFNHIPSIETYLPHEVFAISKAMLQQGKEITKADITTWYGAPSIVEDAQVIHRSERPPQPREQWRYEHATWILLFQFDETGLMVDWKFQGKHVDSDAFALFTPSQEVNWLWRVESDISFNSFVEKMGNTILVEGDDGWISGHHEHSNLYALDDATGELLWKIEAGFEYYDYHISNDQERISVLTRVTPENEYKNTLQTLHLRTGEVLHHRELPVEGRVQLYSGHATYMLATTLENQMKIAVYDDQTHELLWEKTLEQKEIHVVSSGQQPQPLYLLNQQKQFTAFDEKTGEEEWSLSSPAFTLPSFASLIQPENASKQWFIMNDGLIQMNVTTGETLKSISLLSGVVIDFTRYHIVNDDFLVHMFLEDNEHTVTTVYFISSNEKLWEITLEGNNMYSLKEQVQQNILTFVIDGILHAFTLETGESLWKIHLGNGLDSGQLLASNKDVLIVSDHSGNVYVVDHTLGRIVYRIQDQFINYKDVGIPNFIEYIDGVFYTGSSNGKFGKMTLPNYQ